MLVFGVILIPYPGPGWLVVFAGLAILATEFAWAGRVLAYARARYDQWTAWLGRQPLPLRLLVLAATGLVILATLWLLGMFSLVAGWFGIHHPLLDPPFSRLRG
ncbi:Putative transmembrane protein (PGPGW) [Kutzneria sp. CA-103260]|nr:Putative transmembrane protein (PGPGW) [Kutzneria sp. CA-103260]